MFSNTWSRRKWGDSMAPRMGEAIQVREDIAWGWYSTQDRVGNDNLFEMELGDVHGRLICCRCAAMTATGWMRQEAVAHPHLSTSIPTRAPGDGAASGGTGSDEAGLSDGWSGDAAMGKNEAMDMLTKP